MSDDEAYNVVTRVGADLEAESRIMHVTTIRHY